MYSDVSDTGYGGYTVEHGYHMSRDYGPRMRQPVAPPGSENSFRVPRGKATEPTCVGSLITKMWCKSLRLGAKNNTSNLRH